MSLIVNLHTWADKMVIGNEVFYKISKKKIITELPLLTDKEDTVYRLMKQLEEKELISIKKIDGVDHIATTKKCADWNRKSNSEINPSFGNKSDYSEINPKTLGNKSEQHSEINPTDNNTIYNQNTNNQDTKTGGEEFFEQQEYTPPPMPNSILGELSAYWVQVNPLYKKIATPKVDNPAIRQIAERITGQKMFHLHPELTMKKWKAFCQVVLTNDFYSQKPLKTIANNIQTFLPDIERAENGQYTPKDSFKNNSASIQLPPQKIVMDKRQGHFINNGATIRL